MANVKKPQKCDEQRTLYINKDGNQHEKLFKLKKGWTIRFVSGFSVFEKSLDIFIEYPVSSDTEFKRHEYHLLPWVDGEAKILLTLAGSFHYYIVYKNELQAKEKIKSGFLIVDPDLKIGEEVLPLECIQMQTVLAKCLGPLSTWTEKILVAKNSGYNVIHFTPIQELGDSESSYCIRDHLKVNPAFNDDNNIVNFHAIELFVDKMRTKWKMLSICDIVLNHTANESLFLKQHPECAYNCSNSPHLRPAYLLDIALSLLTSDVGAGKWENNGIPRIIKNEEHLHAIRNVFYEYYLPLVKIHELYTVNVNEIVTEFLNIAREETPHDKDIIIEDIQVIQDPEFRRLKSGIDLKVALKKYNVYKPHCEPNTRLYQCAEALKCELEQRNNIIKQNIENHIAVAAENVIRGIRYFRLDSAGPRIEEISQNKPLVPRYFTDYNSGTLEEKENIMYSDNACYLMVHNGWVIDWDPLINFAEPNCDVYLRRELIAWGDSIKLRYGNKPEDCPFLWNRMTTYVEQMAKIFNGIRLDNCHSTPIPVAQHMIDAARRVRPDLYVVAELFTNKESTDNMFINHLGITTIIREAMNAVHSQEEGRLIHRFGGDTIGSFRRSNTLTLVSKTADALLFDVTHDNPNIIEKRNVYHVLPHTALVSLANCAIGSNRGYDELVPHEISVVDEKRQYPFWTNSNISPNDAKFVNSKTGIIAAKKALNDLHYMLGEQGFSEVYVDQRDNDIIAVTRHSPVTRKSVILIAFTAYSLPESDSQRPIKPLEIEGIPKEIILEASLKHVDIQNLSSSYPSCHSWKFNKDENFINGLSEYVLNIKQHIQCSDSEMIQIDSSDPKITKLHFVNFKPGSIVIIRISPNAIAKAALRKIENNISEIINTNKSTSLNTIIDSLDFSDLNVALYKCNNEKMVERSAIGMYYLDKYGCLVYAGLQGVVSILDDIRPNNILEHPLCDNLRQGDWLIDYLCEHLQGNDGTASLGAYLKTAMEPIKLIPRYLVPYYFDVIITNVYFKLVNRCYFLMSSFVSNGNTFIRLLSLVSVQMGGIISSSPLPILSPNLASPKPKTRNRNGKIEQMCITLSAGLPHFSIDYLRNWGRDTFISLRGLLILTGRHEEARFLILGFASTLRHGLIPNLLDQGHNARYNARDAVWWWLYSIKCYVEEVPNGMLILSDNVLQMFPDDDLPAASSPCDVLLSKLIQEVLNRHFEGIFFKERNAGKQIDEYMTDCGFYNKIGVNHTTGFVFGGNSANCGTWMDKMGSSSISTPQPNIGIPATPRDGSAVELVGLSKAVISFLANLYEKGQYPYSGVEYTDSTGMRVLCSYDEWANKITCNFEKYFYLSETPTEDELNSFVNRRGIIKDTVGSSYQWADYQFRPNFLVTLVVAPELLNPLLAWKVLEKAEKILLGPLGMKTLDPEDWAYRGYYNNSNPHDDITIANGFNYHQGPEWLWLMGYFLRARLYLASIIGGKDELQKAVAFTTNITAEHFKMITNNPWRGLPELTNKNGAYCKDSCPTQAWSAASILEVFYDLEKIKERLLHEE